MKKVFKKIYSIIPFKKSIFSFIKVAFKPGHSVYKHLHFKGVFEVKVNQESSFKINHYGFEIENEIFWNDIYSGWEKVSLKIWSDLCEQSEVIFDIGANTGVYSLLAKTINPKAKVYAFEPVKRVHEKLVENIELNDFDTVAENKAISDKTGVATIYDKDTEHTLSVTINKDLSPNKEDSIPVEIDTIRLDEYIITNKIKKIDLLKIDVETHEPEVLEGFGKFLKEFEPTLIIEILNDEIANKIESYISNIDYSYYVIDEKTGIQKVSSLRKSDYFNFLICKPEIAASINSVALFEDKY
ncbi:MAG: FkbM family methyltransferase [Fluviicola sp.]|nr:FkbM family methyltransferase [Fluviicola sp.]